MLTSPQYQLPHSSSSRPDRTYGEYVYYQTKLLWQPVLIFFPKRGVNTRTQSESSATLFNSGVPPSKHLSIVQGSTSSYQDSTLRSSQSPTKLFFATTRTNSIEMAKTDMWGDTIRSKISTDSATERKCRDKDLPALPLGAFMPAGPRNVVLEGNAPTQDTVTWEGMREPDMTEKGSQDIEAHGVADIKPTGRHRPGWI